MTIEIDDSGTGEIVGDAFIGFHRKETGEIIIKRLPLEWFDEYGWAVHKPLFETVDLVLNTLVELNHKKEEELILCRGYYFDRVRVECRKRGISYKSGEIEGILQETLEKEYLYHIKQLGFESPIKLSLDYEARGKALKRWVAEDYQHRLKYVKSGLKKGFRKLIDYICYKNNVEQEEVLQYHIRDSVIALREYCRKNEYFYPKKYIYFKNKKCWKTGILILLKQFDSLYTVGISVRQKEYMNNYSKNFLDELDDLNALTGIGYGEYREGELKACAKICDKLGIQYKDLARSNYWNS